jgi:hypothetical protein
VTENSSMINDSWTGLSGTKTSSPIGEQTIYTLTCTSNVGGANIVKTATVNIIPKFQEQ